MPVYRWDRFELRSDERVLLADGERTVLAGRAFDLLVALIERRDRVVGADELLGCVWQGRVVEEGNLSVHIAALRRLLGREAIATVHGHGYRFVAPIAPAPLARPEAIEVPAFRSAVAVLPFRADDDAGGAFGVGDVVSDQLITALSGSDALSVISRLSTACFRQQDPSLAQVAQKLGVRYVVSGACRSDGGMLSIHAELADVQGGHVLWADDVRATAAAALHPYSDVMCMMAAAVIHSVQRAQFQASAALPLPDLATHALLLRAIHLMHELTPSSFERAQQALDLLLERAPHHPLPLAWRARWHLFRFIQRWTDDLQQEGEQAHTFARRAVQADPSSPTALTFLGNVQTGVLRDLDAAEQLYRTATQRNPSEALAWLMWGNACSFRGQGAQALAMVDRADRLSPLDPARYFYDGIAAGAALTAGAYETAIEKARSAMLLNDAHASPPRVLAIALWLSGRHEEARRCVADVRRREPLLTVSEYVRRSPGAASGMVTMFAKALADAGLPP